MRASYTAAVVVALLQAEIHLDWVAGISAGSSNTANYLARDTWRAKESFVGFAADPQFGDLRTFLRGQGMFNANYIYQQTGQPAPEPAAQSPPQRVKRDQRRQHGQRADQRPGQQRIKGQTAHCETSSSRSRSSSAGTCT